MAGTKHAEAQTATKGNEAHSSQLGEVGLLGIGQSLVQAVQSRGHVDEQAVQVGERGWQRLQRVLVASAPRRRPAALRQHPLQIRSYRRVVRHRLLAQRSQMISHGMSQAMSQQMTQYTGLARPETTPSCSHPLKGHSCHSND